MAERFTIPRKCKTCKKPFIGRDKDGVRARYCSRGCHFREINLDSEKQSRAAKVASLIAISKRGTGTKGYIKEFGRHQHRVVVENVIGRKLRSDEIVHHKDHNKHNNDPSNLQIVTRAEHARIHFSKTIPSSGENH